MSRRQPVPTGPNDRIACRLKLVRRAVKRRRSEGHTLPLNRSPMATSKCLQRRFRITSQQCR